jgi:hypothetical protein
LRRMFKILFRKREKWILTPICPKCQQMIQPQHGTILSDANIRSYSPLWGLDSDNFVAEIQLRHT